MVVKLYFTDGSVLVRSFSDEELKNYKILNIDELTEYIENLFHRPLDTWWFREKGFDNYGSLDQLVKIDLRDYFTCYNSFLNKNIDGKIINKVEYFSEDSYEYTISLLEGDGYVRDIFVEYDIDHYRSWKNRDN